MAADLDVTLLDFGKPQAQIRARSLMVADLCLVAQKCFDPKSLSDSPSWDKMANGPAALHNHDKKHHQQVALLSEKH